MSENQEVEIQDFDIEVPNIPLPRHVEKKTIDDKCDVAFKFSFIGTGQGGSRLAETFWKLGYKRVCAINTAQQDLKNIDIPEAKKFCISGGGAGKDPKKAERAYDNKSEDVLDFMRRSFGPSFDKIFICLGSGGGTGAGTVIPLVKTARNLYRNLKIKDEGVGVIVALPQNSEGKKVNQNSYGVLSKLLAMVKKGSVSPLIILDNERISKVFPGLAVDPFWDTANKSICTLFHLFNLTAIRDSHYTSFDKTDYRTILNSGVIVFGATPVKKWDDATDISASVRDNLKDNILSGGIDLSTGDVAGIVVIGGQDILKSLPQSHLDHGFDQLSRILGRNSTVHRGIYRGNKDNLVIYTMIGGLGEPKERLIELKNIGGIK